MSLTSPGTERKRPSAAGSARPPRLWILLAMLAAILYLIWFLGRYS